MVQLLKGEPQAALEAMLLDESGKIGQAFYIWGDEFTFANKTGSANTPPVADAGLPQAVQTGDTVVLDGSNSSDSEAGLLTYHWSFVSKPTGSIASLDTTDPVRPSFVADASGSYVLSLIVNDSTVDSAPDTVEITAGCSGDMVTISNTTLHSGVISCIATKSIIIGPNVTVKTGAELWLDAPVIEFRENVLVESGGTLLVIPVP